MLVLSRKVGEKIMVGNNVEVVVTKIAGDRVTLGIAAPREVLIRRQEIAPKDQQNQKT